MLETFTLRLENAADFQKLVDDVIEPCPSLVYSLSNKLHGHRMPRKMISALTYIFTKVTSHLFPISADACFSNNLHVTELCHRFPYSPVEDHLLLKVFT